MINIVYVFLVDIILEAGMIDQSAGENAAVLSDSLQMESGILYPGTRRVWPVRESVPDGIRRTSGALRLNHR